MAGLTTMASLHLRRTFRYPEELDIDDGMREEPDEEGKNLCLKAPGWTTLLLNVIV